MTYSPDSADSAAPDILDTLPECSGNPLIHRHTIDTLCCIEDMLWYLHQTTSLKHHAPEMTERQALHGLSLTLRMLIEAVRHEIHRCQQGMPRPPLPPHCRPSIEA